MLKYVIVINGSINAGKTSVAKAMAEQVPHSAFIDGDEMGNQEAALDRWIPSVLKEICDYCTKNAMLFENIFIAFPLRQEDFTHLYSRLDTKLICITLSPFMDVALSERGGRKLEEKEKQRIREMYAQGYHCRQFSALIHDNSHETLEQTVQFLLQWFTRVRLNFPHLSD